MPLETTRSMLTEARRGGYAIGAFNCENMEMIQAVLAAAGERMAPVILQATPSSLRYVEPRLFAAIAGTLARDAAVPVAVHLDHGNSAALAGDALRSGYTSIMIDGSQLPFEKNVSLTEKVVAMSGPAGIPVEGELGRVGGKEDDTCSDVSACTDPGEAEEFVRRTGVSSLAIGIGTSHGVYETPPVLNPGLISILREKLPVPLVLHGASGLGGDVIRDCIRKGISKVNFATELRIAYSDAVRAYLAENPGCIDPKLYGAAAREAVKQCVIRYIDICGCNGKA